MRARYWILASLCVLVFSGCAPQQVEVTTPTADASLIGTISRVTDNVARGQNPSNLIPVTASDALKMGDILEISKGGEGLLDFGNFLQLRVFNDTKLQSIRLERAENIPLVARIQLESGGFTGTLQKHDGKALFEAPNGTTITILGTQFWVIYRPADKVIGVGNFGGTINVSAQNVTRPVTTGHYMIVRDGQPPEPERVMTMDRSALENMIRQQGSPLDVLQTAFEVTATPAATSVPSSTVTPTTSVTPTLTITPSPTPACPPVLKVIRTALCRVSPGTTKEIMNVFQVDTTMVPSRRTVDSVWYNVPEPASGLSCWISDANLEVIGNASCLPVFYVATGKSATVTPTPVTQENVLPPPPPTKTVNPYP